MLRRGDLIAAGAVLAAAGIAALVLLFARGGRGNTVVVKQNNETVATAPLDTDREIVLSGNTVVIRGGTVRVERADCKNQICVHHKPISRKGETILCLPHRVSVTVE